MWILTIAQALDELAAKHRIVRRFVLQLAREPLRDRRVVSRSPGEGLGGEAAARIDTHLTLMRIELLEHGLIVGGIDDDSDAPMVLGGAADHCRSANIDILGRAVPLGTFRRHLLER